VLTALAGTATTLPTEPLHRPTPGTFQPSFETGEPMPSTVPAGGVFTAKIDGGPGKVAALDAKPDVGFSGLHSLHYRGQAGGSQQLPLFDVDLPVQADTRLSYVIFPQRVSDDLRNPANY